LFPAVVKRSGKAAYLPSFADARNFTSFLALLPVDEVFREIAMAVAPVQVQVVEEVTPFGDVPLAPSAATGRSEAELARAIAGLLESAPYASDAPPPLLGGVAALMCRASRSGPQVSAPKRAA
jgi:hypothetical protein